MPDKKRANKAKQTWRNKKIVLIAVLVVTVIVGGITTYIVTKPKKNIQEQTPANSNTQVQTEKQTETPAPETPQTPAPEAPKEPEKKPEAEKPAPNLNLPEISTEAPKLTHDKIEKIKLEMTEAEVKSLIGNDTYESAKKAGQNLGSVTLNLSDNNGGIVLGFDQEKIVTITRTYALKTNTEDSFSHISKGMSKEEVVAELGLPTTEMGKTGTIVYSYQYQASQGLQTKVVVFDVNDKVLVVQ